MTKKDVKSAMESLGVYRAEYDPIIDKYVDISRQYAQLSRVITVEDMTERSKAVVTLEKLRADIARYSDMLCLNPKVFEKTKIKEKPVESKLEKAMAVLANG